MNKYIRTKNMIYQVESILRDNGFVKGYNVGEMAFIKKDQVISQADTIEELCDEFVVIEKDNNQHKVFNKKGSDVFFVKDEHIDHFIKYYDFYGAIWCEWGLKYVAKMNEKGEMVLI